MPKVVVFWGYFPGMDIYITSLGDSKKDRLWSLVSLRLNPIFITY